MLVQSTIGELRILPALPDDWDQGSVKGIRARGVVWKLVWTGKIINPQILQLIQKQIQP